jgi:ribonuclease H / adenosylcobalamin/alpha-ribazole phosphatase
VLAHLGAYLGVWIVSGPRSVVIEADGGSRGNPGPSAYGTVLKDATNGELIAEDGSTIGIATNNVAEYSGLIAGLRLARQFAPDADIEVRMDSKLVVEQMSGRWKIKHPGMVPLAREASTLAPFGTTYTWVPRERNKHADRLANEALDGQRSGVRTPGDNVWPAEPDSLIEELEEPARRPQQAAGYQGWHYDGDAPTTVILIRHGVTAHTTEKRFSGGLASTNPPLSDEGRAQIRATGTWLAQIAGTIEAVIASPVRRTLESAEILADLLGQQIEIEPGFAEMEFGHWDSMTFAEVADKYPAELRAWLGSVEVAPAGGESFRTVQTRVLHALRRLLDNHAGQTVAVLTHVTPVKALVAHTLDAPLEAVYRMELAPASVTVLSFFSGRAPGSVPAADATASMRMFNARPAGTPAW